MRAVTKTVLTAFLEGRSKTVKNTSTDGRVVWLHGHAIIRRRGKGFEFTFSGWPTVTTRERINGFLDIVGSPCRVFQKNFIPYLSTGTGSREMSCQEWIVVPNLSARRVA